MTQAPRRLFVIDATELRVSLGNAASNVHDGQNLPPVAAPIQCSPRVFKWLPFSASSRGAALPCSRHPDLASVPVTSRRAGNQLKSLTCSSIYCRKCQTLKVSPDRSVPATLKALRFVSSCRRLARAVVLQSESSKLVAMPVLNHRQR